MLTCTHVQCEHENMVIYMTCKGQHVLLCVMYSYDMATYVPLSSVTCSKLADRVCVSQGLGVSGAGCEDG